MWRVVWHVKNDGYVGDMLITYMHFLPFYATQPIY